jgi:hypothetical protein
LGLAHQANNALFSAQLAILSQITMQIIQLVYWLK